MADPEEPSLQVPKRNLIGVILAMSLSIPSACSHLPLPAPSHDERSDSSDGDVEEDAAPPEALDSEDAAPPEALDSIDSFNPEIGLRVISEAPIIEPPPEGFLAEGEALAILPSELEGATFADFFPLEELLKMGFAYELREIHGENVGIKIDTSRDGEFVERVETHLGSTFDRDDFEVEALPNYWSRQIRVSLPGIQVTSSFKVLDIEGNRNIKSEHWVVLDILDENGVKVGTYERFFRVHTPTEPAPEMTVSLHSTRRGIPGSVKKGVKSYRVYTEGEVFSMSGEYDQYNRLKEITPFGTVNPSRLFAYQYAEAISGALSTTQILDLLAKNPDLIHLFNFRKDHLAKDKGHFSGLYLNNIEGEDELEEILSQLNTVTTYIEFLREFGPDFDKDNIGDPMHKDLSTFLKNGGPGNSKDFARLHEAWAKIHGFTSKYVNSGYSKGQVDRNMVLCTLENGERVVLYGTNWEVVNWGSNDSLFE